MTEFNASAKVCSKCGEVKLLSEFGKNSGAKDGYRNQCKECRKVYTKQWIKDNTEKIAIGQKAYREKNKNEIRVKRRNFFKTDKGKELASNRGKYYRELYPDKSKARSAVSHALRDGKLFKEPCFHCGSTENIEAHHTDYTKPLDVTWMCLSHHRELHTIINRHFKH